MSVDGQHYADVVSEEELVAMLAQDPTAKTVDDRLLAEAAAVRELLASMPADAPPKALVDRIQAKIGKHLAF